MRVLVTGAGGNLGRATMPALADADHTPVAFDFRPVETPFDFVEGDLREPASVLAAAEGCDTVVHAAALHGIHLAHWTSQDYWAINLHGTCNVYDAARELGIRVPRRPSGRRGRSLSVPGAPALGGPRVVEEGRHCSIESSAEQV
jgi:UDP-glucose 4-epimerase